MRWHWGAWEDEEGSVLPWPQKSCGGGRLHPRHSWPALALVTFSAKNVQTLQNRCWSGHGTGPRGEREPRQRPCSGLEPRCAPGCSPSPAGGRGCPCCGLVLQTHWRPQGSPCLALSPWGAGGCAGRWVGGSSLPGVPRLLWALRSPSLQMGGGSRPAVVAMARAGSPGHDEPWRGLVQPRGAALCTPIHAAAAS